MANEVYGLSRDGFRRKRLPEIWANMYDRLEDRLGVKFNRESDSIIGNLFGVISYELADLWTAAEDSYNAMYPNTAKGLQLTQSAMLAGIMPISAEQTQVFLTCYGEEGTRIPMGSMVAAQSNSDLTFSCKSDATITIANANHVQLGMLNAPVTGSTYSLSIDSKTRNYIAKANDTISTVLSSLYSGFSDMAVSFELSNDILSIATTDKRKGANIGFSGLVVKQLSSPILFECDAAGAVTPLDGDVTSIVTTIDGWKSCTNEVAAIVGRGNETDEQLRQRWNASLFNRGSANIDSIQAAILSKVTGVTACRVFENRSDTTDEQGRPPHSIEAVVQGGNDDDIASVIWKNKGAGIDTFGSVSVTISDSQGVPQIMHFNRPQVVNIYLKITINKLSEETWSSDNRDNVKKVILSNSPQLGQDVVLQRFIGDIYRNTSGVGLVEITACKDGRSYSTANIEISPREIAVFDAERIEVVENV